MTRTNVCARQWWEIVKILKLYSEIEDYQRRPNWMGVRPEVITDSIFHDSIIDSVTEFWTVPFTFLYAPPVLDWTLLKRFRVFCFFYSLFQNSEGNVLSWFDIFFFLDHFAWRYCHTMRTLRLLPCLYFIVSKHCTRLKGFSVHVVAEWNPFHVLEYVGCSMWKAVFSPLLHFKCSQIYKYLCICVLTLPTHTSLHSLFRYR